MLAATIGRLAMGHRLVAMHDTTTHRIASTNSHKKSYNYNWQCVIVVADGGCIQGYAR